MEKGSDLPEGKNGSLCSQTTFPSILTPNHPTNCPLLNAQLSGGCSSRDPHQVHHLLPPKPPVTPRAIPPRRLLWGTTESPKPGTWGTAPCRNILPMGFLAYLVATATTPGGEAYRDAFSLVICCKTAWLCRAGPGAGSRSSAQDEAAGGTGDAEGQLQSSSAGSAA